MKQRILCAVVAAILSFLAVAPPCEGRTHKPPRFERVALAPIVIEPQPFEDASERPDQAKVASKLSEEATKQAERILVRAHVAGSVERLATEEAATPIPVLVRGTLRLPVSLPSHVRGWNASRRRGRFASVAFTFTDVRTGAVVGRGEGTCDWNDAWWIYGTHQNRRNAPLDRVLEHFARKTTERAVWDAARRGSTDAVQKAGPR